MSVPRKLLRPLANALRKVVHPSPKPPTLGQTFAEAGPVPTGATQVTQNRLHEFFESRRSGPGVWKWRHYFDVYDTFLKRFVGRPARILEIGVYSGGSLDMWRDYLGEHAQITGVDIQPACKAYEREGVEILIGDQGSPTFWDQVRATTEPFDIVVDDGSHDPVHQATTLQGILRHIRPGGVYICEDIQGPSIFGDMIGRFSTLLHEVDEMHADPDDLERRLTFRPTAIQQRVHSLHVYPMVVVIQKREHSLEEFVAPMHGSQWQPSSQFSQTNPYDVAHPSQ